MLVINSVLKCRYVAIFKGLICGWLVGWAPYICYILSIMINEHSVDVNPYSSRIYLTMIQSKVELRPYPLDNQHNGFKFKSQKTLMIRAYIFTIHGQLYGILSYVYGLIVNFTSAVPSTGSDRTLWRCTSESGGRRLNLHLNHNVLGATKF